MSSIEPIYAKSKRVNQILKERDLRGGEAKEQRTAEEAKVLAGKKALSAANEITGTTAKFDP
jgi:hypothetical protein